MKKIFIISVVILILLSTAFCSAQTGQEEGKTTITYSSGDWDYIENETGISLTVYRGDETDLEIPSNLDEKPVTKLEKDLFLNNVELVSVKIPPTVKGLGSNLFYGCTSLEYVELPTSLKEISENAFRYCSSLKNIDMPVSITSIGNNAFADCIKLEKINLIAVTNIGRSAFSNCISLKEVNAISASQIGQSAFANCVQLPEIALYSATSIGETAFDNCMQLKEIILSRKVSSIGTSAFRGTPWLDSFTDEFVILGQNILVAYHGTDKDVQVPDGVKRIVDAFMDNYQIESVTLPDTVQQIDGNAFRDAVNLKAVKLSPFLTQIGGNAFDGCQNLTEIELPAAIKKIGGSAFANCGMLQQFTFPPLVTEVSGRVLADCLTLRDVIIPDTVQKINKDSFSGSPNVVLHAAFGSAAEIWALENNIPCEYAYQENADFIYNRDEDGIHIVRYIGNLYDVEIPAQLDGVPVISIEAGAFQNNGRVRRIIVPLTVRAIGDWAFSYMDQLKAVQLPAGLEMLGANVFTGTAELTEIRMPKRLKAIGESLFDKDSQTLICAAEGTETAEMLTEMGYTVLPDESCSPDEELMKLWAELSVLDNGSDSCNCVYPQTTMKQDLKIIKIPDGLGTLTADLLENDGERLILIIPSSVTEIDEGILTDNQIATIVSDTGTAAESFAKEQNIQFLIQFTKSVR